MNIQELLDYWAIIRKRWWLILLLVISTVGTILVISRIQKPLYAASLKFLFTTPPTAEMTVYNEFRQTSARDEIPFAKANFIEILTSEVVIWDAIGNLGADITAAEVSAGLMVEQVPNSEFVELSLRCEDPQLAAALTNMLMDAGLKYYGELRARPTTMSRIFIAEQLTLSREAWEKTEEELTKFQIDNGTGNLDRAISTQQDLVRSSIMARDETWAEGGTKEVVANYEAIITEHERKLQNLLRLRSRHTMLQAEVNQTRGTYELLLNRETQAELKENEIMSVGFVSVLGPARKPSNPLPLLNFKWLLLGAIVSLVVGVSLSFGWEYLETQDVFETVGDRVTTDKHKPQKSLP